MRSGSKKGGGRGEKIKTFKYAPDQAVCGERKIINCASWLLPHSFFFFLQKKLHPLSRARLKEQQELKEGKAF